MQTDKNSENWLTRGVIEFDPEIYEKYFKGTDNDIIIIASSFAILFILVLAVTLFIWKRRKAEKSRLEKYMSMDPAADERDGVPPPPDGLTIDRQPKTQEPEEAQADIAGILATDEKTWLTKLKAGLSKTRTHFSSGLAEIFTGKIKISDEVLERVHETLYRADIGVASADKLIDSIKKAFSKEDDVSWPEVKRVLIAEISNILDAPQKPIQSPDKPPLVILMVGVNGVGKTTSCGKLAAHFLSEGKTVMLAAADTFRAAAIDQLKVWGDRLDVEVVAHKQGSDPAAVAFDAVKAAVSRNIDVLLVDTAGRLHSKKELMAELQKIYRVMGKEVPNSPHETWLVIDATTGQNAAMQVKAFKEVVSLSGLIVTKLDGTAKGGVLVGIADTQKLPIRYIGVGEQAADLRSFSAKDYAESLF